MKKSLLVISVILLIAGLFISCNSEAAESSNELTYVKFVDDDAKDLTYSVSPEQMESVNDLYWWYQASTDMTSSLFAIRGKTDGWTRVNSGKGLSGAIGPFTKGNWKFELVGTTDTTKPTSTSFNGSEWTVGDTNVRYYGVSGTAYNTKTAVNIQGSSSTPTTIPVSLKYKSSATEDTFTLVLHNLTLIETNADLNDNQTVWYKVTNGETSVGDIGFVTTADHKAVISQDVTVNNVSWTSGSAMTLTVGVYADEGCSADGKLLSGDVTFTPFTGSTVTVSGSLGAYVIDYGFGEFDNLPNNPDNYEAYIYDGTTTTLKSTFASALSDAQPGNTVGLLKDVTITQHTPVLAEGYASAVVIDNKSITIEGNGHKVSSSIEITDPNKQFGIVVLGGESIDSEYVTVHINNLVCDFTGFGYGIEALCKVKCYVDNCTINTDGIGVSANGEAVKINSEYYAWPENAEVYVSNSNITSRSQMASNEDYKNSALFAAYGGKTVATNCDLNAKYAIGFGSSGATVEYISGTITYAHAETVETAKLCMYRPDSCYYHCTADGQAKDDNNPLDCTIIMHEDYADYYSNSDLTNNVVFKSGNGTASVDGEVLTISVAKN